MKGPHILYLGLHFKDLTFILDGNPTFVTKEVSTSGKSKIKHKKKKEGESGSLSDRGSSNDHEDENHDDDDNDAIATSDEHNNNNEEANNTPPKANEELNDNFNDERKETTNINTNDENKTTPNNEKSNDPIEEETTTATPKEEFINMTKFTSITKIVLMIKEAVAEPFTGAEEKMEVQQLVFSFFFSLFSFSSLNLFSDGSIKPFLSYRMTKYFGGRKGLNLGIRRQ